MRTLLLVIDVQTSFINEHTENYVSKIDNLIKLNKFDLVAFTKFVNSKMSSFYNELHYNGCMTKKEQQIVLNTANYPVFEKTTYTAVTEELLDYIKNNKIDVVYLCGIETDACVLKGALDLFDNNIKVKVLKDYSMSHSGIEYHNLAIKLLTKLIGEESII